MSEGKEHAKISIACNAQRSRVAEWRNSTVILARKKNKRLRLRMTIEIISLSAVLRVVIGRFIRVIMQNVLI